MYQFIISADSPSDLKEKQMAFAREMLQGEDRLVIKPPSLDLPEYIDEVEDDPAHDQLPLYIHTGPQVTHSEPQKVVEGFDSRGLPWDERIHASSKNFNKDGSWRTRRNISEELVKQVEQELLSQIKMGKYEGSAPVSQSNDQIATSTPQMVQSMNETVAVPINKFVVPPPPVSSVAVEMPSFANSNPATRWDNAAPAPTPQSQPVTGNNTVASNYENIAIPVGTRPAHSLATFKANLTTLLAQLITENKINQEYLTQLEQYFNVKNIWNVLGNEAQCIELYNTFVQGGLITKVEG